METTKKNMDETRIKASNYLDNKEFLYAYEYFDSHKEFYGIKKYHKKFFLLYIKEVERGLDVEDALETIIRRIERSK